MPPATPSASAARARQELLDLLDPLVSDAGFDLEDVTVTAAGRRSLVRVVVDADGGVDLDAIALISRIVADALDADAAGTAAGPVLRGSYVLEVSSPGIDRPLREPRHWRRATGRLVTVEVAGRPVTGRVTQADDRGVQLDVDGGLRAARWDELGSGKVQIEFHRAGDDEADGAQEEG